MIVLTTRSDGEGWIALAARGCDAGDIGFLRKYTSGVIFVAMAPDWIDRLQLGPMTRDNASALQFSYTVSVDVIEGTTTGISADDRAQTIRKLADPRATSADFMLPGHVFPIRVQPEGVIVRASQAEAAVDLCAQARVAPIAVISGLTRADGATARGDEVRRFARRHDLALLDVADVIAHRVETARLEPALPPSRADVAGQAFTVRAYRLPIVGAVLALTHGRVGKGACPRIFLHRACALGDVLDWRCGCRRELERKLRAAAAAETGIVIYLRRPGADTHPLDDGALPSPRHPYDPEPLLSDEYVAALIVKRLGLRGVQLARTDHQLRVALQARGIGATVPARGHR
jgi:3,4-dihydroxy 2-butanone 4-phosphate synthase/GTP cyclohydrolase II